MIKEKLFCGNSTGDKHLIVLYWFISPNDGILPTYLQLL